MTLGLTCRCSASSVCETSKISRHFRIVGPGSFESVISPAIFSAIRSLIVTRSPDRRVPIKGSPTRLGSLGFRGLLGHWGTTDPKGPESPKSPAAPPPRNVDARRPAAPDDDRG